MFTTDFKHMVPMKYYDCGKKELAVSAKKKHMDMLENAGQNYIASCKKDGDWSMIIRGAGKDILIRSRSISKVTGEYGDYTSKLPHIVEEALNWPEYTVCLAEICWDEPNTTANTVGTILRCLPEKAIERQKEHKLKAVIFDILAYSGEELWNKLGYKARLDIILTHDEFKQTYLYPTSIFYSDFAENADRIIRQGGEGIVIQRIDNLYMPDTRTAWKTLKVKQKMDTLELPVVCTVEPNKAYQGNSLNSWPYWKDNEPVTKFYYLGWKSGIVVRYNNVDVKVTSGLTDDDREWLSTDEAAKAIAAGQVSAEVSAMEENSQGSLRHPYVIRLRYLDGGIDVFAK